MKNPPTNLPSAAHLSLVDRRDASTGTQDFYERGKRIHNPATGQTLVKIFAGDCYVTAEKNEVLATILGSCIAVCARDVEQGIGGMNHFLLPGESTSINTQNDTARYGVNAMERLINGILARGGKRENLEFKVFGGGNVIPSSNAIGSKNVAFIIDFLVGEGFELAASDVEGTQARRIHYYPTTGKVMLLRLRRREDALLADQQDAQVQRRLLTASTDEIELFGGGQS